MKILFSLLIITLLSTTGTAQVNPNIILNDPDYDFGRRLKFGFSVGTNVMDFSIRNSVNQLPDSLIFADLSQLQAGFNVNGVSLFRLSTPLQLRFSPGMAFGQRNLQFINPDGSLNAQMNIESAYVELPLSLKYNAQRKTNARPYLLAGVNYRIDLAAYRKIDVEEGIFLRLVRNDLFYEFGVGYEFFLTYFKFSTEIKLSRGIASALANDFEPEGKHFFNAIDQIRSQIITISLNFE